MELALRSEVDENRPECANCGATSYLLRCSRCHTAHFCGVACQKAYWPFHRLECKRNEFADAMEEADPKFAGWMRQHGKMAVLKDDEVDRLERAAQAASGPSREEVMESMYGRLEPRPRAPTYTPDESAKMEEVEEAQRLEARRVSAGRRAYDALEMAAELGAAAADYKWRQTQTHVEVFVPVRPGTPRGAILVNLTPTHLEISIDDRQILSGPLWREVKVDESTWYVQDGVLELILLKRHRRGNYTDGETNASTFWYAVVRNAPAEVRLTLEHPPARYYLLPLDDGGDERRALQAASRRRRASKTAALTTEGSKLIAAN